MKLWIAEKPSVAKAICAELGIVKKGAGFNECKGGNVVTWCFGHLLEQAEPDFYTDADIPVNKKGKKIWRMKDLPIFPKIWKLNAKNDKGVKAQLKTIKGLLVRADIVVNCGDPDREGQLLVDEILEFFKYRKSVQRFWVSAQDSASIRKGLASLQPNAKFKGMKLAAEGRSRADWLLGMNLTRALTLAHSTNQQRRLIAVGRVQTPTLALVAQRDELVKNFKPVPFYNLRSLLSSGSASFTATWKPSEGQIGLDSEKRLISSEQAKKLFNELSNAQSATVLKAEKTAKKTSQPKSFSLADIQLEASNRFGFTAQETLDTCQSLYEVHKIASYPRSDCQFLPESQHSDAASVLSAIAKTAPQLASLTQKANPNIKSATWNDQKITAHHGIIPTQQSAEWSNLTEKEKKIYELIARRYLAQFFPEHSFDASSISLKIKNETFSATGKVTTASGWKVVYGDFSAEEEKEESNQSLPALRVGSVIPVKKIEIVQDKTKAPASFTEGSLIAAMEKIHNVVENPEHKKLLKDGDGIGTPATRAAIITELKNKGYLESKGKKIHATQEGVALLDLVPALVKNPVLTAIFERKLKEVEAGKTELESFLEAQKKFIQQEVSKAKALLEEKSAK